jgi:hypothetical protein
MMNRSSFWPSRSTPEAVIFQPNTGVSFAVVFGDVAWRPEMSWKERVAHGAPKCLGTGPFRAKAASFMINVAPTMWVLRAWLELRAVIPCAMPSVRRRFRSDTRLSRVAAGQETFC